MKKSLLFTAAAALVLGLAACGKSSAPVNSNTGSGSDSGAGGGGGAAEVDIPREDGKVSFYFELGAESVAIPDYCGVYLTGKFADWATAVDSVCVMKNIEGTRIWSGTFDVADDLADFGYQMTLGYNVESGAPSTGVNWSYKSDECQAASGESGTENATFEIVDGLVNLGTHTWSAAPGEVKIASNFDVSITLAEAVPTWVTLYMPGNLRNNWECDPELDAMTPSEDRKTWTIHVDEAIVGTFDVKVIAEYTTTAKGAWSWANVILDNGAGGNYSLMVLRAATNSVININEEEDVEAYPADFSKLPDPDSVARVNATITIILQDENLPDGALGLAIKGSFDGWTGHALTVGDWDEDDEERICTYTYENLAVGSYEFGLYDYSDADAAVQGGWYSAVGGGNIAIEVVEGTTDYVFGGSFATGFAAAASL